MLIDPKIDAAIAATLGKVRGERFMQSNIQRWLKFRQAFLHAITKLA